MKRSILVLSLVFVFLLQGVLDANTWKKYTTSSSISFHYPSGWQVKEQDSAIEITNANTQEQLIIVAIPFDKNKNPLALAKQMINIFKQGMPDIKASGFRESEGTVYFQSTYTENEIPFQAEVLVVKDTSSAHWFSYSAPREGYNQAFGIQLLQDFIGTIASGSTSKPPTSATSTAPSTSSPSVSPSPSSSMDSNAQSFLFVLEFTLGAPLNHSQEQLILSELLKSWKSQPAESLKKFDMYPKLVTVILGASQHDLEKLRKDLEQSTREWLDESNPNDSVVKIIRKQLDSKSAILVTGNPPLTEMAATAYSELLTYAELLSTDRNASPSNISQTGIDSIRQRLKKSWSTFNASEKEDILTTPGLWITFRTLLQFGNASEKEKTRAQLLRLAPSSISAYSTSTSSSSASGKSSPKPMSMVSHNVLMNINQMTFNSYMWSRGFHTTRLGY